MYRPVLSAGTAAALLAGVLVASAAEAGTYISIRMIPTKVVAHGGHATIKPVVSASRKTSVRSKRLTVRRGTSYVARGATSVRLAAGSYRVTTSVRYRVRSSNGQLGRLRSASRTQSLAVRVDPTTVPAASRPPAPTPTPVAATPVPAPTPTPVATTPVPTPTPTPVAATPVPAPTPEVSVPPELSLAITGKPCDDASLTKSDGTPWTCAFSDEFSGTSLDSAKWIAQQTATSGYQNGGECFVDDPDNISVAGGMLRLTVRKEAEPFTCESPYGDSETSYTAGMVSTWGRFTQARGRYEIRAAFPTEAKPGLHSALWLWPEDPSKHGDWPASGEIDIAEMYSQYSDRVIPYIHYASASDDASVTNNYCMVDDVRAFHTYVLEWTSTHLRIAIDGQTCVDHAISPLSALDPFQEPYLLALTQALGLGTNARTTDLTGPATTEVDYVRVWR